MGQFDGYLDDDTVADKGTVTETFAAAKLHIDNPRWAGVPFLLSAGKAVAQKKVEVKVLFNRVPGAVGDLRRCEPNELVQTARRPSCARDVLDSTPRTADPRSSVGARGPDASTS